MTSVAKTKEVTYRYDMFDRRIAKDVDTNGDGTVDRGEWYAYDGQHVLIRSDRAGAITARQRIQSCLLKYCQLYELTS